MGRQEALDGAVDVQPVPGFDEAVTLVLFDDVLDRHAAAAQGFDDLVGLGLLDPGSLAPCSTIKGAVI